jgi:hypothetical protein
MSLHFSPILFFPTFFFSHFHCPGVALELKLCLGPFTLGLSRQKHYFL